MKTISIAEQYAIAHLNYLCRMAGRVLWPISECDQAIEKWRAQFQSSIDSGKLTEEKLTEMTKNLNAKN